MVKCLRVLQVDALGRVAQIQIDRTTVQILHDSSGFPTEINVQRGPKLTVEEMLTLLSGMNMEGIASVDTINQATVRMVDIVEKRESKTNDGGISDGVTPEKFLTNVNAKEKFFPRGMRGFLYAVDVYSRATAGGKMKISFSNTIGQGGIDPSYYLSPTTGWKWQRYLVKRWWNYDCMHIGLSEVDADVSYAYDENEPYDAYNGSAPYTYEPENRRYFIRPIILGSMEGYLTVGGTVNTIENPSGTTQKISAATAMADDTEVDLVTLTAAGQTVEVGVIYATAAAPAELKYRLYVYIDGAVSPDFTYLLTNDNAALSAVATSGHNGFDVFHQQAAATYLKTRLPFKFTKQVKIAARQVTGGAVNGIGFIIANVQT